MKKITTLLLGATLCMSSTLFADTALNGSTGIIDFPTAFNLRSNNYTVSGFGMWGSNYNQKMPFFGASVESGFLSCMEAGVRVQTTNTDMNNEFLLSNIKLQVFRTQDNMNAVAFGYNEGFMPYAYAVVTHLEPLSFLVSPLVMNGGITFDQNNKLNAFGALQVPVIQPVALDFELYTYNTQSQSLAENMVPTSNELQLSYNAGISWRATSDYSTKFFYRDVDNSWGIQVNYLGIFNG
ncbi:MAG: hypothetical protein NTX05_04500 [Fusobacteria bacterium]|nr:hypothetical protein [Fusobacteriota bacterium]